MIDTDIVLEDLSAGDLMEDVRGAQVFLRLAKQPSPAWLECFEEALKASQNALLSTQPPEIQREGRPRIRVLVSSGVASAKVNAVREVVVRANEIAAERNKLEDAKGKAALDTAARQKATFEAIKKELLGA